MTMQEMLQQIVDRAVARQEVPNMSVLVRCKGEELAYVQSGYADRETQKPLRRDTIFRLYSQSKPITAAAAMILVERGVIDLLECVDTYLPGFRGCTVVGGRQAGRAPFILELLGMTSGCCYPGEDEAGAAATPLFLEQQKLIDEGKGMSTLAFCNRIGQLPLAFDPGTHFRYGTSADVLGAVIEAADGRRFSQFLQEELFGPLGMKDTAFWVPEEKRDRFVTCYRAVDGGFVPWQDQHLAVGRYDKAPAFESGGAGLVSTLDDYAAFAQMLLNGGVYQGKRILSEKTVRFLTADQMMERTKVDLWENMTGYGYGKLMRVCTEPGRVGGLASLGEYGWDGWLGSYFANFPKEQLTILTMTNRTDTGTSAATRKVRNAVLAAL